MRTSEDQLRTLMVGGLDGDAAAHAALLRALVPLLRAFFRRRLSDAETVEDLVQDTLISIHTRRASYDRHRPFAPWLFAIARYRMVDHFRASRRNAMVEEIDDEVSIEGFEDASIAAMDVARLLDTLPPKQADAIRRTRLEGFSVAEAAAAAGIGESDVKVSAHRGLKALSDRLKRQR